MEVPSLGRPAPRERDARGSSPGCEGRERVSAALPPSGPPPGRRLVGRSGDLDAIRQLLLSAPRVAGVVGEPGVGKTAVLAALAEEAEERGCRVLRASGARAETHLPYAAVLDLLDAALPAARDTDPETVSRLEDVARTLTRGAGEPTGSGALWLRRQLLTGLLRLSSASRPLLVVVDDQHWVDPSSWSLLSFVAHRLAGSDVSLVAASRSRDGLTGLHDLPVHHLQPLDPAEAAELLGRASGRLGAAAWMSVLDRAGGNPLALLELGRHDPSSERGQEVAGALPVPARIQASFAAELPALPTRTRALLLLAAAGGVELMTLSRAGGSEDLGADLEPAELAGLVRVVDGTVHFRHSLLAAAVYSAATVSQRVRAHGALAGAVEGDPDRRVWHLAAAAGRQDEQLAHDLVTAAEHAEGRGAHAEAARAMLRASELSPDAGSRERRMLRALTITAASGHLTPLLALADRLRAEARDPEVRVSAGQQVAFALAQSMRQDEAFDALEQSLGELLGTRQESGWASLTTFASLSYQTGRQSGRVRAWYESFRSASAPDPEPGATMNRAAQAWIEASLEPLDRPDDLVALVRADGRAEPALPVALRAAHEMLLGATAWLLDESEVAIRRLTLARGMMRGAVSSGHLVQTLMALGQAQFDAGAYPDADETAQLLVDAAEAESLEYYAHVGQELRLRVAAVRGDDPETRRRLERLLAALRPGSCAALEANLRVSLARSLSQAGDETGAVDQLLALFDRAGRPLHPHVALRALADLASTAVRAGRSDEALPAVRHAQSMLEGTGNVRFTAILHRAMALQSIGDQAEASFEMAVGHPDAGRWPLELASAQLDLGVWLRRRRRNLESRRHLAAAQATSSRLGAAPLARLAATELRAAGITRGEPAEPAASDLTAQERQIVELAAQGLSNREIGSRMFLSPRTVSSHLYHAFPKLGVTSRSQLRDVVARWHS